MPIGKNSLKRVSNNGYSAVKSTAPDMENSEVVTSEVKPAKAEAKPEKATPVSTKKEESAKPATAKKPAARTTKRKSADKSASGKTSSGSAEKKTVPEVKTPARRGRPPKKKPVDVIPTAPETAVKVAGAKTKEKGYYNIGDDMPIYLL